MIPDPFFSVRVLALVGRAQYDDWYRARRPPKKAPVLRSLATMIHLQCPSCKQNLEVADYLAGLPIVCKFCSVSVPVPAKSNLDVKQPASSKLAERLAFIKDEPAQPPPPLAPVPAGKKQP